MILVCASDNESEKDIRVCDAFWTVRVQRHGVWTKECTSKVPANLAKSDFCKATVIYPRHNIGQAKVKPLDSKVQAILDFPNPTDKK